MTFNYVTLRSLPDDLAIGVMFKFLGKIKNASLMPSTVDSDCPPILFWWFEQESDEANQLIKNAVNNFPWEDKWMLENKGNGKWLLFPEKIRDAERVVKNDSD